MKTKTIKITVAAGQEQQVIYALSRIKGVVTINDTPAEEFDNVRGENHAE